MLSGWPRSVGCQADENTPAALVFCLSVFPPGSTDCISEGRSTDYDLMFFYMYVIFVMASNCGAQNLELQNLFLATFFVWQLP